MREGYIGILLVFVFSVFAASFMMSLPDLRIYRNTVNMLNGLAIPARAIPETVDIDDAVVGSIVVLAVPESTIGMSFDAYRSARKSQDYARDIEKALIASDWKFLSRSLPILNSWFLNLLSITPSTPYKATSFSSISSIIIVSRGSI